MIFNETHSSSSTNGIQLAFIKSLNVQVYPCGRRRSEKVSNDNNDGTNESYIIPFDPEARLNTEANNIKHSSLNGFTQTYLKSTEWADAPTAQEKKLSVILGGYLFNITLDEDSSTVSKFVEGITDSESADYIYANIRIEETPLFSGFASYTTSVLRNQTETQTAETSLDLLTATAAKANSVDIYNSDNYYFSGLSFSSQPLTKASNNPTRSTEEIYDNGKLHQRVISLCILENKKKDDSTKVWQVHQPALLPSIEHGETANSIKVKDVSATKLDLEITDKGTTSSVGVPALNVVKTSEGSDIYYQLQFLFGGQK